MFSNKWIRNICYIFSLIIDVLAIILIILGIIKLANNNTLGWVLILGGIIIPIVTIISIYPIFALANIDNNFSELISKFDLIIEQLKTRKANDESVLISQENEYNLYQQEIKQSSVDDVDKLHENLFEYINKTYNIKLDKNDSLDAIKIKIDSIDSSSNLNVTILKDRIAVANDIEEIYSLIKMHMTIYYK